MAKREHWLGIPTELSLERFREFVLPHLTVGSRGPAPKLSLHALFNYILKLLYIGCQWKELPIAKDARGLPEIHYTRIYGAFRRWQADGCFNIIFTVVVLRLHQTSLLDVTIIHGDGTTTAAMCRARPSIRRDCRKFWGVRATRAFSHRSLTWGSEWPGF